MREESKSAFRWLTARNAGIALAVLALVVVVVGVGLSFQRKQQLRRISQQATNPDSAAVREAVEDWRERGWLEDGHLRDASMIGVDLQGVDLSGADLWQVALRGANLAGADLSGANLSRSNLHEANLEGADLTGTNLHGTALRSANLAGAQGLTEGQLARTEGLIEATLPDGTRYDGRYRLPADLDWASGQGIEHKEDDAGMAAFYGVPLEVYQGGQEWADTDDNLTRVRGQGPADTDNTEDRIEPGAIAVLASVPFSLLVTVLLFGALSAQSLPAARE